MAFQIAQPRPRVQVAASTGSRCLKTRLAWPDRKVQAIVVSQAGSPTPVSLIVAVSAAGPGNGTSVTLVPPAPQSVSSGPAGTE
jgi:hypothetical protein